jgi:hypothetical protein
MAKHQLSGVMNVMWKRKPTQKSDVSKYNRGVKHGLQTSENESKNDEHKYYKMYANVARSSSMHLYPD